jgi:large repetitive protein
MQKLLLLTAFIFFFYCIKAQTFSGNVGSIPSKGTVQTCFTASVSGVGNINTTTNGLAGVCLDITHPNLDELEIVLRAPDGTTVPLSVQNGGSGNNYTGTCFSATATNSIKFASPPFTGTFLPEGYLGDVNNGQNADGTWELCIQDRRNTGNGGSLTNWSITFNNTPAPQPSAIPACSTTLPGTSSCANATPVCDFNGLCGNTMGSTIQDWPGSGLDGGCFGLENNSFIKFEAGASTASFTVWVPTTTDGPGGGIQMLFFSGTCGSGPVTTYGCYPHIFPYQSPSVPLATIVTATGLTPGNIYYLMIDGFGGDKCTFRVAANSGIDILNITPSTASICGGSNVNLTGTGGNGGYTWSPATGLNSTTSSTVTASPAVTTMYTLTSTNSLGCSLTKDVTVSVNDRPVITTQPTSTTQNVCQNGTISPLNVTASAGSGTISSYQWYINTTPSNTTGAPWPSANLSTFTPSLSSTGTLYFYCKITNSNGCSTTSNVSGAIIISPKVNAPVASATVQPTCLAPTGILVVTPPFGANFEYSIGGAYQASGTFTGLAPAIYNVTAKNIVTGCISSATTVTLNALPTVPATPAGSVTVQPSCAVPTATIDITSPSGAVIEYSVGGAYQAGTSFTGLTNGTTYTVTAKDISTGCISSALLLNVNAIAGVPAAPTASVTTHPDCYIATGTITITAPAGANIEYSIGGAYQPGNVFIGLAPGTAYTVAAKDISSGCVSLPTNLSVNNITPAPPPTGTSPLVYCQNTSAPVLTATGTNLLWYSASTGGIGSAIAPTPSTAIVGSTNYYVSQTTGSCESPRAAITVTISAPPAVTTPVAYCENAVTTPLSAAGTGLLWYNTATGGTGNATAPTPSSASTGNTIYYVSQTTSGCESPRASITVTVNPIPAVPAVTTPVVYCQNLVSTALAATGTNLLWYTAAMGGIGSATASIPSTTTAGNKDYYVTQTIIGCESPRAVITVTVNPIPAAPAVTTPVVYCQNSVAAALAATGTNLLWYTASTGGTGSATAPIPLTTTAGTSIYYVSQTINGCESARAAIIVTITALPAAPAASTPVMYCENEVPVPLSATGTSLLWFTAASSGTGNTSAPTPSLASTGNTIYYVSQTFNGCESARAAITVTVNPIPAAPVTAPVVYCQNTVSTALTAAGSNLLWFTAATGGTGSATAPTPSTTTAGSTIYYVSQTINGCESARAAITVTVNPTPATPIVTTPVVYCQNLISTALTATGTDLLWYTAPMGSTGSATAPVPSTATPGNTNYYVTQTLLGCESPGTVITITVNATPAAPAVVSPVTYCQNSTANALTASGSNLLWYNASTGGTGDAAASAPSTSTPGNTFYYVSQTIIGCEGPRSAITVTINIDSTAVTTFKYSPDTVCINGINNPGPAYALGFTIGGTFSSTAGISLDPASGNIKLSSSTPGSYLVKYNYNTTGCIKAGNTTTRIIINPAIPTVTLFSYSSPVCKNDINPLPTTVAGFTSGGNFISSPGIVVKPLTGEVSLSATTPGSYLITYSLPALGCRAASNTFSFLNIVDTTRPVTKFSYTPAITCITASSNPVLVKGTGFTSGGTFSATPAGLNINSTTGAISIGLSTPGVYKIKYSVPKFLCRLADSDSTILTINAYGSPVTDFSYYSPVCQGDTSATPVPETDFTSGGIFSSTAGLVLNPNTGIVDLTLSKPGNYIIKYAVAAGDCNPAGSSASPLNILKQPELPDVSSVAHCGPGNVSLSASSIGTIKWYTEQDLLNQINVGNTLNTFVENTTLYYLTSTVGTCESKPAVLTALVNPLPEKPFMGNDTAICNTDKLVLNPGLYNNYLWQDGSTQQIVTATTAGNYKVIVRTGAGCSDSTGINISILDNCDDVYFPSAFSPDGNLLNDKFGPLGNLFIISNYSLRIFNRFGDVVFSTRNPYEKWDGMHKGKVLGTGNFVYVASYTYKNRITKTRKGSIMIVK